MFCKRMTCVCLGAGPGVLSETIGLHPPQLPFSENSSTWFVRVVSRFVRTEVLLFVTCVTVTVT